jgi:hypothetical protein
MADIAKRKRAKEVLRQSEEHLQLIIDTIPTMARPFGLTARLILSISVGWIIRASLSRRKFKS